MALSVAVVSVTGLAPPAASASEPTSAATQGCQASNASHPGDLLDLTNWKLQLPVDTSRAGSPDEVKAPELASFSQGSYFNLNDAKDGVVFRAHAGGATTKNSKYPRSELREMTNHGEKNASWSTTSGTHTMALTEAITSVPSAKPHVTAAQIHNGDDVIVIRLEGKRLFADHDGENLGDLDTDYRLGTVYTVKFVASGGRINVFYNDVLRIKHSAKTTGNYFKIGAYTQSNTSKGDKAGAYSEVVVYDLQVTHE